MFKKLFFIVLLAGPVIGFFQIDFAQSGQEHESSHVAKAAHRIPEALVQIYQAKEQQWKGMLSVRTWIATKEKHSRSYVVYEVLGSKLPKHESVVSIQKKAPDEFWYGQKPEIIYELKGLEAELAIPKIDQLARQYPHTHEYEMWFGPNDNTFVSHIVRHVDQIQFSMPSNAMGKDYIVGDHMFARSPSKTGYQFNYKGLGGFLLSRDEGVEVSIFGLVFGVNPMQGEVKLPGYGSVSIKDIKWK
ncbi:MAG: DUF3750 domain-containing protein [Simkaniaceae bacterium]|nr:DUF3750 domain-containing protein [Simkaniaceae bacterium]